MFAIARAAIDVRAWSREIEDPSAGAFVSFEGRVRNHARGREVRSLAYEVYEALAVGEGERVLQEASSRFDLARVACVHRAGCLSIGDLAVWVGVSASHREEAFAACRYVIDEVKARVPIWKRETYADGETVWVDPSGRARAWPA